MTRALEVTAYGIALAHYRWRVRNAANDNL